MTRQYIEVEFSPGGRTYCYHNDGAEAEIGDTVEVDVRGELKLVTVVQIAEHPGFPTKPIARALGAESQTPPRTVSGQEHG